MRVDMVLVVVVVVAARRLTMIWGSGRAARPPAALCHMTQPITAVLAGSGTGSCASSDQAQHGQHEPGEHGGLPPLAT